MKATTLHPRFEFALLLLLMARPGAAQQPDHPEKDSFAQGTAVLGANAMVGGMTAGIRAWIEGRPVGPAFLQGAIGGSLMFAGKRIAVEHGDLAPFTGRMVAALGSSIVAHATTPPLLDTLHIAAGPFRFRFGRATWKPGVSFAVWDAATLAILAAAEETTFDWSRSFSSLTPVFITRNATIERDGERVMGYEIGGTVVLDGTGAADDMDAVFNHEIVHVAQYDFAWLNLGRHVDTWIRATAGIDAMPSWLFLDPLTPALWWAIDWIADGNGVLRRITEAEAAWFENR